MSNCLVTGGAGFIGSHIVERLLKDGHSVRVVDNFSSGLEANLAPFGDRIELLRADIADESITDRAVRDMEYVFHLAAVPSVQRSVSDPILTNKANIQGTLNVLWSAHRAQVRRVIYASSSSVYGDSLTLPKIETMAQAPLSPYALQKATGENYARIFTDIYGLQTVSLRFFNVFGPRQNPNSTYAAAIPKFISALLRGEPPTIYGNGEQSRDFTYIANVVHANLLAMTAPAQACGRAFNVGCGQNYTLNKLIAVLNELLGTQIAPRYEAPKKGDVRDSLAGIEAIREALGYEPQVQLAEGLEQTIDWLRVKR